MALAAIAPGQDVAVRPETISELIRKDDWTSLSHRPLDEQSGSGDWPPERVFTAATALGSRAIMIGLIATMTMAGRTEEVIRMQAEARERKPEFGAEAIRAAHIQVNDIIHRRHHVAAVLRAAVERDGPDRAEIKEALATAECEGLATDGAGRAEINAATVLLSHLEAGAEAAALAEVEQREAALHLAALDLLGAAFDEVPPATLLHSPSQTSLDTKVKGKGRAKSKSRAKGKVVP